MKRQATNPAPGAAEVLPAIGDAASVSAPTSRALMRHTMLGGVGTARLTAEVKAMIRDATHVERSRR